MAAVVLRGSLSALECEEVKGYPEVYYVSETKYHERMTDNSDRLREGDHLAYRYQVLQALGAGAFGTVYKVYDHKLKEIVAIKVLNNAPEYRHQARVELELHKALNQYSSYFVHMLESFRFRGRLCIALELLGPSLYDFMKTPTFTGFTLHEVKAMVLVLVRALVLLENHQALHCDIKPENILIAGHSIKLVDFGSGCFAGKQLYTYIQSRFYRAPEVILGIEYSAAIDMWSLGCVAYELFKERPLFCGANEEEQIVLMMEYLGVPPAYLIHQGKRSVLYFKAGQPTCNSAGGVIRMPGPKQLFGGELAQFEDFVRRCLEWDAGKRITPAQALEHPWLADK